MPRSKELDSLTTLQHVKAKVTSERVLVDVGTFGGRKFCFRTNKNESFTLKNLVNRINEIIEREIDSCGFINKDVVPPTLDCYMLSSPTLKALKEELTKIDQASEEKVKKNCIKRVFAAIQRFFGINSPRSSFAILNCYTLRLEGLENIVLENDGKLFIDVIKGKVSLDESALPPWIKRLLKGKVPAKDAGGIPDNPTLTQLQNIFSRLMLGQPLSTIEQNTQTQESKTSPSGTSPQPQTSSVQTPSPDAPAKERRSNVYDTLQTTPKESSKTKPAEVEKAPSPKPAQTSQDAFNQPVTAEQMESLREILLAAKKDWKKAKDRNETELTIIEGFFDKLFEYNKSYANKGEVLKELRSPKGTHKVERDFLDFCKTNEEHNQNINKWDDRAQL